MRSLRNSPSYCTKFRTDDLTGFVRELILYHILAHPRTFISMASIKGQPLSALVLVLALTCFVQGTFGTIECENLNKDSCAFAVSSTGKRCVLEKHVRRSGAEEYACATSQIQADKLKNWIETDACIDACGLDRSALGISSDSLLESRFVRKLCSQQCFRGCPNVVDLYFNLAAGEGAYLPKLCEAQGAKARREMAEIKSSGYVAPAPELPEYAAGIKFANAPAPSIASF